MLIKLNGTVVKKPVKLKTYKKGVTLYECYISNKRKSGTEDIIRVTYTNNKLSLGDLVYIEGEIRTYRVDGRNTLYVYTNCIEKLTKLECDINEVTGSGVLSRDIKYRTNDGTSIADVSLKCDRAYNKYSYVYCSVWNDMTSFCKDCVVGDTIHISGRLHSKYRGDKLSTEISVYNFRKGDADC